MVVLNRIYTRTGDDGTTALSNGERRPKSDERVAAYGTVDETNATVGLARLSAGREAPDLDAMLGRIQNDLFDLGADLATPPRADEPEGSALRIVQSQVDRLERDIDALNAGMQPLRSFVLPAGTATATALHLARTVCRRAERHMVATTAKGDDVSPVAMAYINRLSDFLFVASRYCNQRQGGDVLWVPGQNR